LCTIPHRPLRRAARSRVSSNFIFSQCLWDFDPELAAINAIGVIGMRIANRRAVSARLYSDPNVYQVSVFILCSGVIRNYWRVYDKTDQAY
jgi:hypothetical protein